MNINAFPFGSATALASALRTGKVSSVELLQAYLAARGPPQPGIERDRGR